MEKLDNGALPESESQIRLKRLEIITKEILDELSKEEKAKIKAIILYGSTARGEAKEGSDFDIHIDLEPYDHNLFKKIVSLLQNKLPDNDFSFSSQNLIKEGRIGKLITAQKNPNKPAAWNFLFSRDETAKLELDEILATTQKKEHGNGVLEILARFNDITDEEIADFRNKILPAKQMSFDKKQLGEQKMFTLLANCSTEELKNLARLSEDNGTLLGMHEIRTHLQSLYILTGDKRYVEVGKIDSALPPQD